MDISRHLSKSVSLALTNIVGSSGEVDQIEQSNNGSHTCSEECQPNGFMDHSEQAYRIPRLKTVQMAHFMLLSMERFQTIVAEVIAQVRSVMIPVAEMNQLSPTVTLRGMQVAPGTMFFHSAEMGWHRLRPTAILTKAEIMLSTMTVYKIQERNRATAILLRVKQMLILTQTMVNT